MKPKEVIELAHKNDVKFIDLKFIDFPGVWQHTTIPAHRLDEALFEDGLAFDGSSVRGWQPINASDMTMIPDPETAKLDPFFAHSTLSLTCSVYDPITKQPYSRDPRHIANQSRDLVHLVILAHQRQPNLRDHESAGVTPIVLLTIANRFEHTFDILQRKVSIARVGQGLDTIRRAHVVNERLDQFHMADSFGVSGSLVDARRGR